jgi:hypothetical protein
MLPFNKFEDTLSTSQLYEKEFRHCKSDFTISELDDGRLSLTISTGRPRNSAKIMDSHLNKIKNNAFPMIDYIHSPVESSVIKYIPSTPDFLMPGYKIKIR